MKLRFKRKRPAEERNQLRWDLDSFISVYDHEQDLLIGRIHDISTTGMCVLSDMTVPVNNFARLRIECLRDDNSTEDFSLPCRCIWVRPIRDSGFVKIGFQFIGASSESGRQIQHLIRLQKKLIATSRRQAN